MKKTRKLLALLLVTVMALSACGGGSTPTTTAKPAETTTQAPAPADTTTQAPAPAETTTQAPAPAETTTKAPETTTPAPETTEAPAPLADWDGAYMEREDFQAYFIHDLQLMVEAIEDQLDDATYSKVMADQEAGEAAIRGAGTVAEIKEAYKEAFDNILMEIPLYDGVVSYKKESNEERTNILGILERFAVSTGITGVSLYENGAYVMYNPRITLGTENYIVGYGFGTMAEGAITEDLEYETNPDWKRYYHTYETMDPGHILYHNDQGSQVGDMFSYIAASFYTNFMNETKDGYDWVPELAKEKPVAVNDDDGDGMATTWKFEIRTGKGDGLKYTTGSELESRKAFNDRLVELEDYITPFKFLLTQANNMYRGTEMANSTGGAIAGAKDYYNASKDGFNEAAWEKVGVKAFEEGGKSYFQVEFAEEQTQFYCMYYISSSLYMPLPQEFIDLVGTNVDGVSQLFSYNNDKTESPVDNALALGAFYLERWDAEQQVVYKKNPNYVFADTKYQIEGVHDKIFPAAKEDPTLGFQEFLAGHFDAASIPKDYLDEYRNDPRTRTTTGTSNYKINANACDQATWEYLFGTEGVVKQNAKEDYWDLKPLMGNHHFIQGVSFSLDRQTYANARGSIASVEYLSSNYMSDPENGVSYSTTDAHKKAIAPLLADTDGKGYSLELARDYFRLALTELEAEGALKPGTKDKPTELEIEFAWMTPAQEESFFKEIKDFIETAFNDESVSGGVYKLTCVFWVGNEWSDVYYNKMMTGQFDFGYGSITGNSLNPLDFMSVLSSDQEISGNFTLNWGVDTNTTDVYPIVYDGHRWSYDALQGAANGTVVVSKGQKKAPVEIEYTELTKNEDGSYTGSFTLTSTNPEIIKVDVKSVVCCNYERYRNGDGEYDETELEDVKVEEKNGVYTVTFTVPAELAEDYATGSGKSEEPKGITGFDLYYDLTIDGNVSTDLIYGADDVFEVK